MHFFIRTLSLYLKYLLSNWKNHLNNVDDINIKHINVFCLYLDNVKMKFIAVKVSVQLHPQLENIICQQINSNYLLTYSLLKKTS